VKKREHAHAVINAVAGADGCLQFLFLFTERERELIKHREGGKAELINQRQV